MDVDAYIEENHIHPATPVLMIMGIGVDLAVGRYYKKSNDT